MKAVEQEKSATITVNSEGGDSSPKKFESKNPSVLSIVPNKDINPYKDKSDVAVRRKSVD